MRIEKSTIESLKNQGITISIFPTDEAEMKKRDELRKRYEQSYQYENQWDTSNGKLELTRVLVPDYKEKAAKAVEDAMTGTMRYFGLWYNATVVYIRKGDMLMKRTVPKGKVLDEEYILKVVERDSKAYSGAYGEFARNINKMFSDKFGSIGHIYPTTYGIGVWVFYNWHAKECVSKVEGVLKDMNVEYRTEYSDAKWVYRFVISKTQVNRQRLVG